MRNERDLRIIFELQERLTRISREIEKKREDAYEMLPELINIYSVCDGYKRDDRDNPIIDEKILDTCRVRVEVMFDSQELQKKLVGLFPGMFIEVMETTIEYGKWRLAREVVRQFDRLSDAISGFQIEVELDEKMSGENRAYLNVNLCHDTPEARAKVHEIFPNVRVVFSSGGSDFKIKFFSDDPSPD